MEKKPKEGDIFEIPLPNGEKAYGQYLHYSKMGPIVQIYSLISTGSVTINEILTSEPLFPPVITGLFAAIKEEKWKVVGHQSITDFVHPMFVTTLYDQHTGEAGVWFLWDGQKDIRIGSVLPQEYKNLEFLVVWDPSNVVRRIETREIPFPYNDLIKHNKFIPMK